MAPVAVGDQVPNATLIEDSPEDKKEYATVCAGKKLVICCVRLCLVQEFSILVEDGEPVTSSVTKLP